MKHGGNIVQFARQLGCSPAAVLDFSANINPNQAVDLNCLQLVALSPYSDPDYGLLKVAINQRYPTADGVDLEVFNGASAAIFALLRWLQPQQLVLYAPLYVEYAHIAAPLGCQIHTINRFHDNLTTVPKGSTVVFVNPATPDGQLYDLQDLLSVWQAADCTIIIDESFLDFCEAESVANHIANYAKLFVIKSLSKFYGCAGIRIGFVWGTALAIAALKQLEPAWKLSSLDMAYMQQALANTDFIVQTRAQTIALRALLHEILDASGLFEQIYPGQANFLLARLRDEGDGYLLQQHLARSRVLIRVCDNFVGLNNTYVRFAVKTEFTLHQLARSLKGSPL
ncbi:MAG: aminotransferase class I/II-fold pyridoxal phosphate-dependent enzyme [Methylococcaceae bacterium]|nr:aminotransferase class I/II-fold pyridoxal phosphate-dependent enzyme [Methylococcaceae bacterium]